VHAAWRDAHTLAALLRAAPRLLDAHERLSNGSMALRQPRLSVFVELMRELDLAILMGGALFRPEVEAAVAIALAALQPNAATALQAMPTAGAMRQTAGQSGDQPEGPLLQGPEGASSEPAAKRSRFALASDAAAVADGSKRVGGQMAMKASADDDGANVGIAGACAS
jgi:hypothetical protein